MTRRGFVTRRRRAASAIPGWVREIVRERDSMFRLLFENSQLVVLLIDPAEGRVVDANPAACAFYGWDRGTMRSMAIHEINTLDPETISVLMARSVREECGGFDFHHRDAAGAVHPVRVASGPIRMNGRDLLYSVVQRRLEPT